MKKDVAKRIRDAVEVSRVEVDNALKVLLDSLDDEDVKAADEHVQTQLVLTWTMLKQAIWELHALLLYLDKIIEDDERYYQVK